MELDKYLIPSVVFFAFLITGLITRKIIFTRLSRWASKTETEIDDVIIHAVRRPFIIWCIMLSLYAALDVSKLPQDMVHLAGKILLVLGIASITLVLANMSAGMVKTYSARMTGGVASASLTQNITRIVIFGIGVLVVLNSLGISITPILATLGVGGLAVALALQETLSNLFAGFHISLARQISIGDYIRLETGEEGYVTDINWRTTKIRTLPNNAVLVPNSKLAQAIVTNYALPDKEIAVLVNIGVHYMSDLDKVERVTIDVAREVMKSVEGAVPAFEPFIRYSNFGDFNIQFTVIMRAKEFVDQYLIKHEFIRRLHERYKKEGIIIPYPIRAINYDQEKAL